MQKEFNKLDGSVRKAVLAKLLKLQKNSALGEKLGEKRGLDLTGYRKMHAHKKKVRIVYRKDEGKWLVFFIAVGKHEDLSVYHIAYDRKEGEE